MSIDSTDVRGEGEAAETALPALVAAHRFFFHPVRHTSLGLAVIEAMMVGMPVVGLATTELVTVIDIARNGCTDTRPERLLQATHFLFGASALNWRSSTLPAPGWPESLGFFPSLR